MGSSLPRPWAYATCGPGGPHLTAATVPLVATSYLLFSRPRRVTYIWVEERFAPVSLGIGACMGRTDTSHRSVSCRRRNEADDQPGHQPNRLVVGQTLFLGQRAPRPKREGVTNGGFGKPTAVRPPCPGRAGPEPRPHTVVDPPITPTASAASARLAIRVPSWPRWPGSRRTALRVPS
jgi:hypothetical protein